MQPVETLTVDTPKFYCDGGKPGAPKPGEPQTAVLGHPRVFLTMTKAGTVDCPYCGRHFVLAAGAATAAAH